MKKKKSLRNNYEDGFLKLDWFNEENAGRVRIQCSTEESRSSVELSHSENNHRSQAPVALLSLLSVGEGCRTRRHIKWATKYYEAKFMAIMSENKIDRLRIRITFSTWRDFFPWRKSHRDTKCDSGVRHNIGQMASTYPYIKYRNFLYS